MVSLELQTYQLFELIVVDQNNDDRVKNILSEYENKVDFIHIKTDIIGLSHARNLGIKAATGNILSFPDDDCSYPSEVLEGVKDFFLNHKNYNFISLKTLDESTLEQLSYTPLKKETIISESNIFHSVTSIGLFVLNKSNIPNFDEKLGLGAIFSSCEEMDFVHQLKIRNFSGIYLPTLHIFHPKLESENSSLIMNKIKNNSKGHGAYCKKYFLSSDFKFKLFILEIVIIRPLAGLFISLLKLNFLACKKYSNILIGRVVGFYSYDRSLMNLLQSKQK